MVNKSLLPVRFRLPVLGEYVFYTRGLKYNFELIFFWGPGVWTQSEFVEKKMLNKVPSDLLMSQSESYFFLLDV